MGTSLYLYAQVLEELCKNFDCLRLQIKSFFFEPQYKQRGVTTLTRSDLDLTARLQLNSRDLLASFSND